MKFFLSTTLTLLIVFFLLPFTAAGQNGNGFRAGEASIAGQVLDSNNAAVAGAVVELRPVNDSQNAAADRTLSVTTDSDGQYRLPKLSAGKYKIKVTSAGFSPSEREITLTAGENKILGFTLKPGELSAQVTVTATRTVESIAAVPGSVTVIDREQLNEQADLSTNIGDALGKLVPGLAPGSQSASVFGQTLRGRNALVLIDGIPQSTTRNISRDLTTIDQSAIERVEVMRGATALYGEGATGGIINIITKRPTEGK